MRRVLWMIVGAGSLLGLLVVVMSMGLLARPAVVSRSELFPLPASLRQVYDGTYPCRGSGDSGWEYRYLVLGGDEGRPGGILDQHLRARGFSVEPSADEWRALSAKRGNVEVWVGPLSSYFDKPRSIQRGPLSVEVRTAVRDELAPLALVELVPGGEQCEV